MCLFRRRKRKSLEAEIANIDADRNLKRVLDRDPEVKAVARTLRVIRERNHFAEQLDEMMRGHHAR